MPQLSALEQTVIDHLDYDNLLQMLDTLVRVQSIDGSPAENEAQRTAAALMQSVGMEVNQWSVDMQQLSQNLAYSAEVPRDTMIGTIGRMGGTTGKTLLLNGHTDVVPVGNPDRWTVDPWGLTLDPDNDRVYGRGTCDMKGAICCAMAAIKAIVDSGVELKGSVLLEPVFGEEDGGSGTLAAIEYGITADACIVMEPTELNITPAQAGSYNFRIKIPGKAAHGALRHEGVDPLTKFLNIYQALLALEKTRNADVDHPMFADFDVPYPICVGKAFGGSWPSTVMEVFTLEGRYGIKVGEDPLDAMAEFETMLNSVASEDAWLRENPPILEWWGGTFDPAEIPLDAPIVHATQDAFRAVTDIDAGLRGIPAGTDMRLLINQGGIPSVLFGPGDVRMAHQDDEFVPLNELKTFTEVLVVTILRFCDIIEP